MLQKGIKSSQVPSAVLRSSRLEEIVIMFYDSAMSEQNHNQNIWTWWTNWPEFSPLSQLVCPLRALVGSRVSVNSWHLNQISYLQTIICDLVCPFKPAVLRSLEYGTPQSGRKLGLRFEFLSDSKENFQFVPSHRSSPFLHSGRHCVVS